MPRGLSALQVANAVFGRIEMVADCQLNLIRVYEFEKFGEKKLDRGDIALELARDRMQEQSNARNRLTTKASIGLSALGILATAKLPDTPMGSLAGVPLVCVYYVSLIGMYICILLSAWYFFKTLGIQSYKVTPVTNCVARRHKDKSDDDMKRHATKKINRAFNYNRKRVNHMAESFSHGIKYLICVLFFRSVIQLTGHLAVTS